MNKKTTANIMKAMGATLAVCSAVAMIGGTKSTANQMKKSMKKTADKVVDFVDTMASIM